MPRFELDLRWTDQGRKNVDVPGKVREIRDRAKKEAVELNITVISAESRLDHQGRPDLQLGPIWVVEGAADKVQALVKKFEVEKNVTVVNVTELP